MPTLTCIECGCNFECHRVKRICGPVCSKARKAKRVKAWFGAHPGKGREFNDRYLAKRAVRNLGIRGGGRTLEMFKPNDTTETATKPSGFGDSLERQMHAEVDARTDITPDTAREAKRIITSRLALIR